MLIWCTCSMQMQVTVCQEAGEVGFSMGGEGVQEKGSIDRTIYQEL